MDLKSKIILIYGPTASGKSKLALDIAEKVGGVVINADSMQIYNTISLITARPSNQDMDTIPHFLYGYIDPKIRYSVGEWISDIEPLINFLIRINKIPVIVGGTGLYFAGLFGEISEIPEISAKTKLKWEEIKEQKGTQALFDKLKELDPKSADTINSTDTTNDIAFANHYTSSRQRLSSLETFTSSIDTTIKTKLNTDDVLSGSIESLLPSGVISGSAQITDGSGIFSGSLVAGSNITINQVGNNFEISSSLLVELSGP
mgnify:CR=1 FL=1